MPEALEPVLRRAQAVLLPAAAEAAEAESSVSFERERKDREERDLGLVDLALIAIGVAVTFCLWFGGIESLGWPATWF